MSSSSEEEGAVGFGKQQDGRSTGGPSRAVSSSGRSAIRFLYSATALLATLMVWLSLNERRKVSYPKQTFAVWIVLRVIDRGVVAVGKVGVGQHGSTPMCSDGTEGD